MEIVFATNILCAIFACFINTLPFPCFPSSPPSSTQSPPLPSITAGADEPPAVRIEPRYIEVNVGDPVEMRCVVTAGNPRPDLEWTGGRNGDLNPASSFVNGVFRIPSVRKADEAEYRCVATNSAGTASVRTIIYVTGGKV